MFQTGGFPDLDSSFFFCPFLSLLGLSRFFRDFPDLSGDSPRIFPICPFSLSRPIKSTYEEQSRKGPRHNLDLSQKTWETPGVWKPPGLASLNCVHISDTNPGSNSLSLLWLLHPRSKSRHVLQLASAAGNALIGLALTLTHKRVSRPPGPRVSLQIVSFCAGKKKAAKPEKPTKTLSVWSFFLLSRKRKVPNLPQMGGGGRRDSKKFGLKEFRYLFSPPLRGSSQIRCAKGDQPKRDRPTSKRRFRRFTPSLVGTQIFQNSYDAEK